MIILNQLKGLGDSKWNGIAGAVYKCIGLDLHSTPGITKVHQKLTKDSGSTIDAFCRVKVSASTGYTFWFSYTSGKIWARSSAGTWTLAYTTVPAAGGAGCLGAMEYNGFIYWATESRLHKVTIAGADDSWAAGAVTLDFGTFGITDASFHPMTIQDDTLWIGDGYRLAKVANTTFTANALDLRTPHRIKCLIADKEDILIGTFIATTVNKASIFVWDGVSPSWITEDHIEEVGVNCFIRDDNYVYAQCGRAGNIYFWNGEQLMPYKRIPGDYSNVKYGEVYPDSAAMFKGIPVFGFSNSPESGNSTGNPAEQGIYSFGSYSKDYAKVLDLSFVISEAVTSGIEIGAVLVEDFNLFVAWKNGSTYGVDKIDYSNKYASAQFETLMLFQNRRDILDMLRGIEVFYSALPSGTSFTMSYSINGGAYVDFTSVTDAIINRVYADLSVENIGSLQIKVAFGVSSNSAPEMEALGLIGTFEEQA